MQAVALKELSPASSYAIDNAELLMITTLTPLPAGTFC